MWILKNGFSDEIGFMVCSCSGFFCFIGDIIFLQKKLYKFIVDSFFDIKSNSLLVFRFKLYFNCGKF